MTQSPLPTKRYEEVLFIRPSRGLAALNLRDLWIYRELIYFLTWRDLKVRYKQTLLGAAWAVLQPLIQMVIFSLLFGGVAKLSSEGLPYPLFNFAALLPWGLFSKAISDAGRSLVQNRNMITKVYFPRLVIPIGSVLAGLVDFAIAFVVLVAIMAYYQFRPEGGFQFQFTPALWTLPLFILLTMITALGASLWLSALNVIYRDVGYVLPFLNQVWFFLTPIVYSSEQVVSPSLKLIYSLNPMAGVVEGFRWALLGAQNAPGPMIAISTAVALLLLVSGLFYFRNMERNFADEI
ncbi:MAG: ABC transporter permease [Anaerolineales bacterium]|nr:ABC transporter permease [Anaerolineales bacterium]